MNSKPYTIADKRLFKRLFERRRLDLLNDAVTPSDYGLTDPNTFDENNFPLILMCDLNCSVIEDLTGQVREAIGAYHKWGKHYMPSLALAHLTQQCNNFMDMLGGRRN